MKPFTPQQVRFLQEIGDAALTVHPGTGDRYRVRGRFILGRGLTSTFISLRERQVLEARRTDDGNLVGFTISGAAKAQLAEQLTWITCAHCKRSYPPARFPKHHFFRGHRCIGATEVRS